ncbi:hypothetical protein ACFFX0_05635 [Citricoccus parietis]|uniref:Uncharacterized protein n=1 Tax=Citricoccus parietis TaxID=592307 RepID=A0ABV5FVL9_9MICC
MWTVGSAGPCPADPRCETVADYDDRHLLRHRHQSPPGAVPAALWAPRLRCPRRRALPARLPRRHGRAPRRTRGDHRGSRRADVREHVPRLRAFGAAAAPGAPGLLQPRGRRRHRGPAGDRRGDQPRVVRPLGRDPPRRGPLQPTGEGGPGWHRRAGDRGPPAGRGDPQDLPAARGGPRP